MLNRRANGSAANSLFRSCPFFFCGYVHLVGTGFPGREFSTAHGGKQIGCFFGDALGALNCGCADPQQLCGLYRSITFLLNVGAAGGGLTASSSLNTRPELGGLLPFRRLLRSFPFFLLG